jgi:hypothetical protein
MAGQHDVTRVSAVAVQNGGHLAGFASAPRRALAELGAGLGGNAYLGHGKNSSLDEACQYYVDG